MKNMKNKTAIARIKMELDKYLTCEYNVQEVRMLNNADKSVLGVKFTCDSEFRDVPFTKQEAFGKWFDESLFVMGITQRAKWINATAEEKLIAFNNGIHPALYGK